MQFEWDEQKAKANRQKHRVSFELAQEIFLNEQVLSFEDNRFNYGEVREVALGAVEGVVLYVVFTVREERIRIISARRAARKEAERYYDYFTQRATRDPSEDEG